MEKTAKKTAWGHRVGTQAEAIDNSVAAILATGTKYVSIARISKETGLNGGRVSLHLNHLIKKKGIWLIVDKRRAQ